MNREGGGGGIVTNNAPPFIVHNPARYVSGTKVPFRTSKDYKLLVRVQICKRRYIFTLYIGLHFALSKCPAIEPVGHVHS